MKRAEPVKDFVEFVLGSYNITVRPHQFPDFCYDGGRGAGSGCRGSGSVGGAADRTHLPLDFLLSYGQDVRIAAITRGRMGGQCAEYEAASGGVSAKPVCTVDPAGAFSAGKETGNGGLTVVIHQYSAIGRMKKRRNSDRIFYNIDMKGFLQPSDIILYITPAVF